MKGIERSVSRPPERNLDKSIALNNGSSDIIAAMTVSYLSVAAVRGGGSRVIQLGSVHGRPVTAGAAVPVTRGGAAQNRRAAGLSTQQDVCAMRRLHIS